MKRSRTLLVIMLAVAALLVAQRAPGTSAAGTARAAHPGGAVARTTRHTVTYDHYSLMIDGRRIMI